jgi:hypothetical protein
VDAATVWGLVALAAIVIAAGGLGWAARGPSVTLEEERRERAERDLELAGQRFDA